MSALGLMAVGFGLLTIWAGFDRVIIFDVLRSFIGAPVASREATGEIKTTTPQPKVA